MQSHTEAILREGIVDSLWGATADLIQYLGPHAPVSHVLDKVELMFDTIASFDVLMQNFYKLKQGRMERMPVYVT